MELLYRATRDESKSFHNKCDNQGPTITLIKNDKGNIFGGYASISWINDKNETYHSAPDSFLFTLTNIYNTEPTKFLSKNDKCEIKHNYAKGPSFGSGHDLATNIDILKDGGWANFSSYTYKDTIGKGYSIFSGNSNTPSFKIKELEVFKLYK